jgi:FG-GAP-like repeat/Dihaem cytochrome c
LTKARRSSYIADSLYLTMKEGLCMFLQKTFLVAALCLIVISCSRQKEVAPKLSVEDEKIKISGERNVQKYCSSCHVVMDPKLLDRKSWNSVLYQMRGEIRKAGMEIDNLEWEMVEQYYNRFSNMILDDSSTQISTGAAQFNPAQPINEMQGRSNITIIGFNDKDGSIVAGDASRRLLYLPRNGQLKITDLKNIPIDIKYSTDPKKIFVLGIGSLSPSESTAGQLLSVDVNSGEVIPLINGLERPVYFLASDLNNDKVDEFLISCFGSTVGKVNTGRLILYIREHGIWQQQVLANLPGATKAIVEDYNKDGLPDIFALFAQGNERIVRYTNEGNFQFSQQILVEYPPVYGISDFSMADMNGDSHSDLIVSNGDNGDYSPVFKPYHGVRVFLNDGSHQFKQEYFQKINGAGRLRVRDFDRDGDMDVVVLSIYPDLFRYPEESLVLLENTGDGFDARYLEREPSLKWMILEAGDVDGDGDDDIITGANNMLSFPVPDRFSGRFKTATQPVVIFENTSQ